jgi:hypothetical protein
LLPFLKKKQPASAGVIVQTRAPDEKPEQDQDDSSAAIESCASELIRAVHSRDAKAMAAALKDAFDILESEPHEENDVEPHSYDAQNQKASQEQE